MPERKIRPVEVDQDLDLWLAQQDQPVSELVEDLLRTYRDLADQ